MRCDLDTGDKLNSAYLNLKRLLSHMTDIEYIYFTLFFQIYNYLCTITCSTFVQQAAAGLVQMLYHEFLSRAELAGA